MFLQTARHHTAQQRMFGRGRKTPNNTFPHSFQLNPTSTCVQDWKAHGSKLHQLSSLPPHLLFASCRSNWSPAFHASPLPLFPLIASWSPPITVPSSQGLLPRPLVPSSSLVWARTSRLVCAWGKGGRSDQFCSPRLASFIHHSTLHTCSFSSYPRSEMSNTCLLR